MKNDDETSLRGRLLIASPAIGDARFERTVIYMCAHSVEKGAMGIVVNKPASGLDFKDLLDQLQIEDVTIDKLPIHYGGPVETSRGFVLHSADYPAEDGAPVTEEVALTATTDILRDIASGAGPEQHMLAIGYAGWAPGQLEDEIKANGWLVADADQSILFGADLDAKWTQALATIGVDASFLSGQSGSA